MDTERVRTEQSASEQGWAPQDRTEEAVAELCQREAFAELHPGWEAWKSLFTPQWNARKIGTQPPVIVHAPLPGDLAERVTEFERIASQQAGYTP